MGSANDVLISYSYSCSVERLWQAITDKAEMKLWYFDIPDFKLKIGHEFEFYEPGDKKQYLHRCKILEIRPMEYLAYSWRHPEQSKGTSVLSWGLTAFENGCSLQLKHENLDQFADAGPVFDIENYRKGWEELISRNLKDHLEN